MYFPRQLYYIKLKLSGYCPTPVYYEEYGIRIHSKAIQLITSGQLVLPKGAQESLSTPLPM